MADIPFNRSTAAGRELEFLAEAVDTGHLAGDGAFTRRCHSWFQRHLAAHRVLLTHSCTAALEMSALLCGLEPGDEVILPPFTFPSTANAFLLRGAVPIFVDIRPDTLNIDEAKIESAITQRTRVIVPVHYAGVGAEMDSVLEIAQQHGLIVVEDAALGVDATYRGRPLGTIGHLGAYSFHATKVITSGEGGALLVNDDRFVERAEVIREKGTDRSRFVRGEVDKYTWLDIGSSYLPSELTAAFLLAQLERQQSLRATRKRLWRTYRDDLRAWAGANGIRLPTVPDHCGQAYNGFHLILPSPEDRRALIEHLDAREIQATFHFLPLHTSPMGRRLGGQTGDFPVTESVSECLLRLPFYADLTAAEQSRVIEAVMEFRVA
jgi:dTDP-4-amino-4,6-dideoxygalactose transaminase